MTSIIPTPAPAPRRRRRFLGILAVFVLIGPPAGAFGVNLVLAAMAALAEVARGNAGDALRILTAGTVIGTMVALPLAYTFGLLSAAGVGLAAAVADRRGAGLSLRVGLAGAGVATLVVAGLAALAFPDGGARGTWLAALLAAHLMAVWASLGVARRLLGPQPA